MTSPAVDLASLQPDLKKGRRRFLELVEELRPELHRYCSRMMGSSLDGEDVVQEALAQGYFKLALLSQEMSLRPWLFRIAHNLCLDALRRRRPSVAIDAVPEPGSVPIDKAEQRQRAERAWGRLVLTLPPKERSCLILKDVLGDTLEEICATLDSPLTAVKAALHRARRKLATAQAPAAMSPDPERVALLRHYVRLFNSRDWDALRGLVRADARLEVLEEYVGQGVGAVEGPYFGYYAGETDWRLELMVLDGEPAIIVWRRSESGEPFPWSAVRLDIRDGSIRGLRDYAVVPYLFSEADLQPLPESPGSG